MMTTTTTTTERQVNGQPEVVTSPYGPALLHEAQSRQLRGRTMVALGGGTYSKRQLWAEAARLGVKLVLVDSDPNHRAREQVDAFLHVDMGDHSQDESHVQTILHLLSPHLPVDGCLTWVEDTVPITARLGHALGLRYTSPVEAALTAKSKARTQNALCQKVMPSADCPLPPAVYASPVVRVHTVGDVAAAVQKVRLPAVMKLEFGAGSVGVKLVKSLQEAEQHMALVQETFRRQPNFPGVGLGYGNAMVLMPRLVGTEQDVDLVMFQSELVAAFVSDNGPTRLPLCMPTSGLMPSVLPKDQKQEVIQAAAACCRGLGLHTGVFNVEMMMTSEGPRLVEVNARMGGNNLRDVIRRVYNVDIFHLALMCACGIRPVLPPGASNLEEEDLPEDQALAEELEDKEFSKGFIMSIMLYSSRHSHALATTASPQRLQVLHQRGEIIFSHFILQEVPSGTKFEKIIGNIAVWAPTLREAKSKLISVCVSLGLETEESAQQVLSLFC